MSKPILVGWLALVLVAAAVAGCTATPTAVSPAPSASVPSTAPTPPPTTPATSSVVASMPPLPAPSDWATAITNPWFPWPRGQVLTYTGRKDNQPTVDRYVVTGRTKTIAGAPATVIINTLSTKGRVLEATEDWYAQDSQGNVWYLGESTKTFKPNGSVDSTEGSWQTGVNGAQAGLFMPANPQVGDSFYQEFYKGQAEDRYTIISMDGTVTVPYGSFKNALVTEEKTALEPTVVSQKYYVHGIGQVYEVDVAGSQEYAKLVSVKKR